MARAVAAAHARPTTPLLFEAGTGVGKSLAYLVPGIIHAVDQTRQLIVSTHTISLQEQLEDERPARNAGGCSSRTRAGPLRRFQIRRPGRQMKLSLHDAARPRARRSRHAASPMPTTTNCSASPRWAETSDTGLAPRTQAAAAPGGLGCASTPTPRPVRANTATARNVFISAPERACASANVMIVNHALLFALDQCRRRASQRRERRRARRAVCRMISSCWTRPTPCRRSRRKISACRSPATASIAR